LLIVADEAQVIQTKGSLDYPEAGHDAEVGFLVGGANDLEDEVALGDGVQGTGAVTGSVCEQVPEPVPPFADCADDGLSVSAVGDVGSCEVDHQ
jgi:hypothetical protein